MGKRRRLQAAERAAAVSLEEQLRELDANEVPGDPVRMIDSDGDFQQPNAERLNWVKKRAEIAARLQRREAKRIADPGKDISGNFDVSPYAARGHIVEMAPKDLGKELPKESQFPKRINTQRVIDRYKAQGHITPAEWNAANFLWSAWMQSGGCAKVTAGYDPVVVNSSPNTDALAAKRIDAAALVVSMLSDVPYRSRGCVRAVVIDDITASDWARGRGYRHHDSERRGLKRLRTGLQALVAIFTY